MAGRIRYDGTSLRRITKTYYGNSSSAVSELSDGSVVELSSEVGAPEGWFPYGTHLELDDKISLVFSEELTEEGNPLWERPALEGEVNGSSEGEEKASEDFGEVVEEVTSEDTSENFLEKLAEQLGSMRLPEIKEAIILGKFTAEEAADAEATRDKPRLGVLSMAQ